MDLNVLPECYVDTKLVKALVPPKKGYNHQKGTNVLKRMNEQLPNEFALGIVDEDVQDRAYAQLFEVIWQLPGSLKLLKHPRRHHYLECVGELNSAIDSNSLKHNLNISQIQPTHRR